MASSARDRLRSIDNLKAVWKAYWKQHSKSAPGVDWVAPKAFNDDLIRHLRMLRAQIGDGYSYSALRAVPISKKHSNKKRLICIPTVGDRIVQRAVLQEIGARATTLGIINDVSFGFVRHTSGIKRGTHAARKAVVQGRQKRPWAFKADISAFFDSIQREDLIRSFNKSFRLSSLEPLIRGAINCEVDTSDPAIRRVLHENGITNGKGLRQGMPLSPILSNFVLKDFDRAYGKHGYHLVRYADDLIVLGESKAQCQQIQYFTVSELRKLGLKVSETKTMICSPTEPVEFLGMELGLRPGSNKYCLTISDEQMKEIRSAFVRYHDWTVALSEGLDVAKLFRRLDQMKGGYGAAYSAADNISDLNERLGQWVQTCATRIYGSIFGVDVVQGLDKKKKTFLMLP